MGISKSKKSKSPAFYIYIILSILVIGLGFTGYILFFENDKPVIDLTQIPEYLGKSDTIQFTVTDKTSGLQQVTVTASQGDVSKELYSNTNYRVKYIGQIGPAEEHQELAFDATQHGFKDGPIIITVSARDFSFRGLLAGNKSAADKEVILDTKPPRIEIIHSERYINPGGTGIAIYRLSDENSKHGTVLNGKFNPGHLIGDGRTDTYVSFFALPFDAQDIKESRIEATDQAGNTASVRFSPVYKKQHKKTDRINVSDGFLETKIPEFEQYHPEMQGNLLEKYLYANRELRKENNQKIADLCGASSANRLWQGPFYRMAGSSRAGFADYRSYFYNGEAVDQQVHLGMDIASTRRAEVKAANHGIVVYADYLGIYGNMVLVDHGQGVFSLYSHLSQINVAPGDEVEKLAVLGLSGTSGMAGGDHLHFSVLINGVFVTPKEWWDPNWIEVTINEPLIDSKF